MDNLTHSLVGALLGQCGLKRLSGRSMATLVIAANLPDIDAVASVMGTQSLALRRGLTHGPIAMLLLPLILTGLILAWDRWRPAPTPVKAGPLLLLAYVGTISHPALDFLNSYGIRLLEPFSSTWFAGDTLFIIDVWVWAVLAVGFGLSRWREKRSGSWTGPARTALVSIIAYIGINVAITAQAERATKLGLQASGVRPTLVVANPVPVSFWQRRMLWRDQLQHSEGNYHLIGGISRIHGNGEPNRLDHPALAASRGRPDVEAFLFWSRMPIVVEEEGRMFLKDQRFASGMTRDAFRVPLDTEAAAP